MVKIATHLHEVELYCHNLSMMQQAIGKHSSNFKRLLPIIIAIAAVVALVGIVTVNRSHDSTKKAYIVASNYPLQQAAQQVVGKRAIVANLTPGGSEPHDFEPSARELAEVKNAQIFLYNGAGIDPWADDVAADINGVAVNASRLVPLIALAGGSDPHFWLDPQLYSLIVAELNTAMKKIDPANSATYQANTDRYLTQLAALSSDYQRALGSCKTRTVVSSHGNLGYLALRYGFRVEAIAGVNAELEPSSGRIAELVELVKSMKLSHILTEPLLDDKTARTIARETGVRTLVFDPIEGAKTSDQQGNNYYDIQKKNIKALQTALGCR